MTLRSAREESLQRLVESGIEHPDRVADWLLIELLGVDRAHLHAFPEIELQPAQVLSLRAWTQRIQSGEPVQYVLGYAEFFGLRFHVTPDVLIPRPETEALVEYALNVVPNLDRSRVLDIGTGCGCIAVSLKLQRPRSAVTACDVSQAAIRVARENAIRLKADVVFEEADVTAPDFSRHVGEQYDVIVSNPPYIPADELRGLDVHVLAEPSLALDAGPDPLFFYRHIGGVGCTVLNRSGCLVLEVHSSYADDVANYLLETGYERVRVSCDLAGHPRVVTAWAAGG